MHPAALSKKMDAARAAIVAHAEQLAAATEQTFELPETCQDLRPNLALPLDVQVLALAELVGSALRLIVAAMPSTPIEEELTR